MYDRTHRDQVLSFEASGGLMNAALVMRDRETDSWWGMMAGRALGGPMDGEPLRELAGAQKAQWKDWRVAHPQTLVLAVDGVTHVPENHYDRYFTSSDTFRGLEVEDQRLPAKESIFAFRWEGDSYAVAHRDVVGGATFTLPSKSSGSTEIRITRDPGQSLFASTAAEVVPSGDSPTPLTGMDTFWYTWIATNPETTLLGRR